MSIDASAPSTLSSQINVAIARKAIDVVRQQGEAAVSLIQSATLPTTTPRAAVSPVPGVNESGGTVDRVA
ncbi:MAG: hypothetical protein AAF108_11835 [Planctomycetota bacterium]